MLGCGHKMSGKASEMTYSPRMRCWIVLFILCTCHCSAAEPDLAALVAALGDTQFKQRIAAEKTLRELSAEVLPQLTPYLETDDIEVRNRLKNIVEYIRDHGPQGVQTLTDVIMNPEVERLAMEACDRGEL